MTMLRFSLLSLLTVSGLVLIGCDDKSDDDGTQQNNGGAAGNPGGGGDNGNPGGPGGNPGGDDTGGGPGGPGPGGDDTDSTGGPGPGGDDTDSTGGPGGPGPGGDDTGSTGGPGGGPGGDTTASVADIQNGGVVAGDVVTLEGVIATSGADADGAGFYVQDVGGGAWSGLYIYMQEKGAAADLGIQEGRAYDITGEVLEYYELTELVVSSTDDVVAKGGAPGTPTVDSVNPDAVASWEQWEGCLVSLGDVTVDSVNEYGDATVDGGIIIDNAFYNFSLSDGDSIGEAVGLIHYAFDEWRLFPRSEADLADIEPDDGGPGGPGGPGGGTTGDTVVDVQDGTIAEYAAVTLEGVIATTGFNYDEDGFFVQDAGGGSYSGVYVYLAAGAGLLDIEAGDELTIVGEVREYYDLTEIYVSAPTDVTETGSGSVTTSSVNPATVSDWEEWEGCLIEVGSAIATAAPDKYGQTTLNIGLAMDDELYDYTSGVSLGTSWPNVRGVLSYSFEEWVLYPRNAADL